MIELKPSGVDVGGVGVFAVCPIPAGQKVADGVARSDFDHWVPWTEFKRYDPDVQKKVLAFCVGTPDGFIPPKNMDFNKLSIEWYLNHSCEGNCAFDAKGDFVAIRNVDPGNELTYDYGLVESNPDFSMNCECRSAKCRKVVTGNDWMDRDFFLRHRQHMHPRLLRLATRREDDDLRHA